MIVCSFVTKIRYISSYVYNPMIKRKTIFDIVESGQANWGSRLYDYIMFIVIIISIIPLTFRQTYYFFELSDKIAVAIFIIDYMLRWLTADYKCPNRPRWQSFLIYPFTPIAIIDLLSILPSFVIINKALKLFRITRLIKILRIFKFVRYSKNIQILFRVLRKEKNILLTVGVIAISYIFITAVIMFNVDESEMFSTFFDALYWATTTLTTVGYGDIYPTSDFGRLISMFSSIFGVAVIALPSGVITASYLDELKNQNNKL